MNSLMCQHGNEGKLLRSTCNVISPLHLRHQCRHCHHHHPPRRLSRPYLSPGTLRRGEEREDEH